MVNEWKAKEKKDAGESMTAAEEAGGIRHRFVAFLRGKLDLCVDRRLFYL